MEAGVGRGAPRCANAGAARSVAARTADERRSVIVCERERPRRVYPITRGAGRTDLTELLFPANRHATVRRRGANRCAARAELRVELLADSPLNGHGEIDVHAAVYRSRLEHRRVVRGNRQTHAAIGRTQIETAANP